MKFHALTLISIIILGLTSYADEVDIHRSLMHWTVKIEGPSAQPGKINIGTGFIMGVPLTNEQNKARTLLVTAAHVLSDILGDEATVGFRVQSTDGSYTRNPLQIRIRDNGVPLWFRHPEVDVAVMWVSIPIPPSTNFVPVIPITWLAGDETFAQRDIHPGDELLCLGYPLGMESSAVGFPILRSGRIASFPVHPSTIAKQFMIDLPVYGGNSGGPVYFEYKNRRIPGMDYQTTVDISGIAGLLCQEVSHVTQTEDYFESTWKKEPLGLAVVVPAEFIRQAIDLYLEKRGQSYNL